MCARIDTYLWPNGEAIVSKSKSKRTLWTVRFGNMNGHYSLMARSKNEALSLAKKRKGMEPVEAWQAKDGEHGTAPAPKPKTQPTVKQVQHKPAKAKHAQAPAVQATPENIKALAKEAMAEYIRDGVAAFVRGFFGAR